MRQEGWRFPLAMIWRSASMIMMFGAMCVSTSGVATAQSKKMSPELLWKLGRLGGASLSPDGKSIAYGVRNYELEKNKGFSSLFFRSRTADTTLTMLDSWTSVSDIQWGQHNDKTVIYFVGIGSLESKEASENEEGNADTTANQQGKGPNVAKSAPQVFALDPSTSTLTQVTDIEDGVANLKVSPTGKHIAFTVDVKMEAKVNEIYKDLPEADARIIDKLMYRHWNTWHDYAYSHIHVATIRGDGKADKAHDIMKELATDCPLNPFGGSEQFNWSPEGDEIALTLKLVEKWAESTDSDVYLAKLNADGSLNGSMKNISEGMEGYDNDPIYSPDGSWLAFHSMERPGFEADRLRIMLFDRDKGTISELTRGLDQQANGGVWSADSKSMYFVSEYRGCNQIFRMGIGDSAPTQISAGNFNWDIVDLVPDSEQMIVTKTSMIRPAELHQLRIGVQSQDDQKLTRINDDIFRGLELPTIRQRWVTATDGKKVHCWVIYPPGFDETKKYPMLLYCQGGPQGQIGQWFSYRWNFHLMAAHGDYVVLAPNRRGLPGFGRAWNDQISKDWGGQAMQDLLSANDSMMTEPYIDKTKVAAIGASFGGYTVYWMMGNAGDRFATMIAHCGVFNLESMYGSTEELFFVNHDLGGPYWRSPELKSEYDRFSPHRFVKNWKTPLMVIHGEKDFRVPVTQGMEAFNAAQIQGVESRFLYFPNEGHWVTGPQNGVVWHRVFFEWLARYCK